MAFEVVGGPKIRLILRDSSEDWKKFYGKPCLGGAALPLRSVSDYDYAHRALDAPQLAIDTGLSILLPKGVCGLVVTNLSGVVVGLRAALPGYVPSGMLVPLYLLCSELLGAPFRGRRGDIIANLIVAVTPVILLQPEIPDV